MKASMSRIESWEGCRRKYYFTYEEEIMGKGASLSAHRGTAIHKGLAVHYGGGDEKAVFAAFIAHMDAFPGEKDGEWEDETALWHRKLLDYRKAHTEEPFDVLGIEETHEKPLTGDGAHVLEGIFDLRVRMKRDGAIWIVDHKTANRTGPSWWTQFFVSKQVTQYQWIEPEARGVLINVLKPTKTESFERDGFMRTTEQLAEFEVQTFWECEEMTRAHRAVEDVKMAGGTPGFTMARYFPQGTQHCHSWGKNCVFLALCQGGEAARVLYMPREKR